MVATGQLPKVGHLDSVKFLNNCKRSIIKIKNILIYAQKKVIGSQRQLSSSAYTNILSQLGVNSSIGSWPI